MTQTAQDTSYILAIDQGTTSTRALIFDRGGAVVRLAQKELPLITPQSGWVEQDARQIWADSVAVCAEVLDGFAGKIQAIGVTNQRETTIVWDKVTGEPVYNAIVWQDRRTADQCQALQEGGYEDIIRERTGLLIDPYFSATKLAWILANVEGARARAERGELLFGTVDSYLIWKLTSGQAHVTDATNASRTMMFNVVKQDWSDALCDIMDIPQAMLPRVLDCAGHFGDVSTPDLPMLRGVVIAGVAGDQQAATFGQACFKTGMVKSTYGTGCFALMNIGNEFRESRHRLLTTVAWRLDGVTTYALEGSIFVAGAAVQFLRDNLKFFDNAAQSEAMAQSVPDTDGVYFVPAFTGLGAPYWDPYARGAMLGLSRGTSMAHITRAALEAQGYQTKDLIRAMAADTDAPLAELRVDGGLVHNDFVCQFIADMTQARLRRPVNTEATAWGAAALAGLGAGVYSGLDEIDALWAAQKDFTPVMAIEERDALYKGWKQAIGMVRARS